MQRVPRGKPAGVTGGLCLFSFVARVALWPRHVTLRLMFIVSDRRTGRRLKTKSSERVIPVHPQLIELGFLKLVAERRHESADAWLFPLVSPEKGPRWR
jgi:hypothetical protein